MVGKAKGDAKGGTKGGTGEYAIGEARMSPVVANEATEPTAVYIYRNQHASESRAPEECFILRPDE